MSKPLIYTNEDEIYQCTGTHQRKMERKEIIYHHENDVNENGQEVGCFRIKSSRLADCFIQLTDLS